MAQSSRKSPRKPPGPRRVEGGATAEPPPIPDPLGDDEHVAGSGRLTGGSRDHEGLLRSGATPLPDGGVQEHPIHDHGLLDDLEPEDFEAQFEEAPKTGFEPTEDDEVGGPSSQQEHPDDSAPLLDRATQDREPEDRS